MVRKAPVASHFRWTCPEFKDVGTTAMPEDSASEMLKWREPWASFVWKLEAAKSLLCEGRQAIWRWTVENVPSLVGRFLAIEIFYPESSGA